ncbi:hypothetical protein QL285_082803 [Trifolium repens]|nr:hypothetical protein QL285_082803 [Trifolium repens]
MRSVITNWRLGLFYVSRVWNEIRMCVNGSAYSLSCGLMDIGRAENSSMEKTTCSECNGFVGTCRGGIVLLLNDVQRMLQEWKHESLCDVC